MTSQRRVDFDIDALYAALNAERLARGMSWTEVTRAINNLFKNVPTRPISTSTVTGMRGRRVVEMACCRCSFGGSRPSFIPAATKRRGPADAAARRRLADTPVRHSGDLYGPRRAAGSAWNDLATGRDEIRRQPPRLTKLANGGRLAFEPS